MWVFAYGSLLWDPGFDVAESVIARLAGYQRSFCMRSIHHRGTETDPGLVLALDAVAGTGCQGLALRVADGTEHQTLEYLRARELISSAYLERVLPIRLADGRQIEAVTYIIDPDHVQYCGGLPLEDQAQIIAQAHGGRGPNSEYLFNTTERLQKLCLQDDDLDWLTMRVRALSA